MDAEQLKLIIDTVSQAGGYAFLISLLLVLKGYFVPLLIISASTFFGLKCISLIKTALNTSYIWSIASLNGGLFDHREKMKKIILSGMKQLKEEQD